MTTLLRAARHALAPRAARVGKRVVLALARRGVQALEVLLDQDAQRLAARLLRTLDPHPVVLRPLPRRGARDADGNPLLLERRRDRGPVRRAYFVYQWPRPGPKVGPLLAAPLFGEPPALPPPQPQAQRI